MSSCTLPQPVDLLMKEFFVLPYNNCSAFWGQHEVGADFRPQKKIILMSTECIKNV